MTDCGRELRLSLAGDYVFDGRLRRLSAIDLLNENNEANTFNDREYVSQMRDRLNEMFADCLDRSGLTVN